MDVGRRGRNGRPRVGGNALAGVRVVSGRDRASQWLLAGGSREDPRARDRTDEYPAGPVLELAPAPSAGRAGRLRCAMPWARAVYASGEGSRLVDWFGSEGGACSRQDPGTTDR